MFVVGKDSRRPAHVVMTEQGTAGVVLRLRLAVLPREGKDLPHVEQPALPRPGAEASPQTSCHPRNPSLEACLIADDRLSQDPPPQGLPFLPSIQGQGTTA